MDATREGAAVPVFDNATAGAAGTSSTSVDVDTVEWAWDSAADWIFEADAECACDGTTLGAFDPLAGLDFESTVVGVRCDAGADAFSTVGNL